MRLARVHGKREVSVSGTHQSPFSNPRFWCPSCMPAASMKAEEDKTPITVRQTLIVGVNSPGARELRAAFVKSGCRGAPQFAYGTAEAYFDTITDPTSTAFQVGGFAGASAVNNGNGTVTFGVHVTRDIDAAQTRVWRLVFRVRNSVTNFPERGARLARRDDREYWAYLRPEVPRAARAERVLKEQRRQPRCPARKMSANS